MSIKAYNPDWAYFAAVQKLAAHWQKQALITPVQHEAIKAAHPLGFAQPHLFIRIGIFIFTLVGCFSCSGFVSLIFYDGLQDSSFAVAGLLCGLGSLFVLEMAIRGSQLYHSGADNALLYFTLGCFVFVIFYVIGESTPPPYSYHFSLGNPYVTLALLPMAGLLVAATVRYADRWVAALAYLTLLTLLTSLLLQVELGRVLLPFAVMLASAAAYFLLQRLAQRPDYLYYKPCLDLVKALALGTFYLGGNYLVVREGNALLSDNPFLPVSPQIPLAALFYLFTAGIPLLYIYVGLRRPHRLWLITGLLTLAFSLYTLRFYRSVLPPEIAATLGGAFLVGLTFWAFRYLRTPRYGLTAAAPDDDQQQLFNIESLIVAQTAHAPTPQAPSFEFGGGSSGGGGAEGSY